MIENITIALAGVGAAVLRNAAGWLENSMEDGKITPFELGQLGATVFRVTVITFAGYYGLGLDAIASAGSAVILDMIIKAFKKKE